MIPKPLAELHLGFNPMSNSVIWGFEIIGTISHVFLLMADCYFDVLRLTDCYLEVV